MYTHIYLPGSGGEKYDDNNLTLIPRLLPTRYVCTLVCSFQLAIIKLLYFRYLAVEAIATKLGRGSFRFLIVIE